eukprot:4208863-Pyramimonas_sp.AAC.1
MQDDSYEKHCLRCERRVTIRTELDRQTIIGKMEYKKGKDGNGRTMVDNTELGGTRLEKWDVLQPSEHLPDVAMVDAHTGAGPVGDSGGRLLLLP